MSNLCVSKKKSARFVFQFLLAAQMESSFEKVTIYNLNSLRQLMYQRKSYQQLQLPAFVARGENLRIG